MKLESITRLHGVRLYLDTSAIYPLALVHAGGGDERDEVLAVERQTRAACAARRISAAFKRKMAR